MPPFRFKQFAIAQDNCLMKVGTDGVLLGAWADSATAKRVLDIGTGTGLLALMTAQRNPAAIVDAVEIDNASATQAEYNIQQSAWKASITLYATSIQDFTQTTTHRYDHIISNPPFFVESKLDTDKSKNIARHTLELLHSDIIHACDILLEKDGYLSLILPVKEGNEFIEMAMNKGFYCHRRVEVFSTQTKAAERLLLQFGKAQKATETSQLLIQKSSARHDYTDAYKELTREFYTIF